MNNRLGKFKNKVSVMLDESTLKSSLKWRTSLAPFYWVAQKVHLSLAVKSYG